MMVRRGGEAVKRVGLRRDGEAWARACAMWEPESIQGRSRRRKLPVRGTAVPEPEDSSTC